VLKLVEDSHVTLVDIFQTLSAIRSANIVVSVTISSNREDVAYWEEPRQLATALASYARPVTLSLTVLCSHPVYESVEEIRSQFCAKLAALPDNVSWTCHTATVKRL